MDKNLKKLLDKLSIFLDVIYEREQGNDDLDNDIKELVELSEKVRNPKTAEDFKVGDEVYVKVDSSDIATHDFTGHVVNFNGSFIQVSDQENNIWDFWSYQLTKRKE